VTSTPKMLSLVQRLLRQRTTILPHAVPISIPRPRSYSAPSRPSSAKDPSWRHVVLHTPAGQPKVETKPEEKWRAYSTGMLAVLARGPPGPYKGQQRLILVRITLLYSSAGRSVKVMNGNIADAYRKLEIRLARNHVRYELKMTERHEKKGVKRRRLSSERWRKRFADEVGVLSHGLEDMFSRKTRYERRWPWSRQSAAEEHDMCCVTRLSVFSHYPFLIVNMRPRKCVRQMRFSLPMVLTYIGKIARHKSVLSNYDWQKSYRFKLIASNKMTEMMPLPNIHHKSVMLFICPNFHHSPLMSEL
jgi:ribosomal protein S21